MSDSSGKVYLVGAGPGDPELLTLKGKRALEEAAVVVYDRLANPRLLEHAPAEAERVYVGKEAQRHAMTQDDINALLVERARAGKVVCRLKGGDPFVFGRGGEEAAALAAGGIEWEYVPGIPSPVAVPGYAGIPVTHRELGSSVAFITAHEDPAKPESVIRWKQLAQGVDTLVFLMGVQRLPKVVQRLLKHGRPAETPAAVITWGTYPRQRTAEGTLADIVERARNAALTPPSILLVGEVASLRERLRWFDSRPLFGRRILVTRAREQAGDLARLIEQAGGEAVLCPTIRVVPIPDPDLSGLDRAYDWTIFTSVNGVYCLLAALRPRGSDLRRLGSSRIAAIGPETARAASAAGLHVDFVPSRFVAEQVAAEFPEPLAGKRVLIARAREARDVLPDLWRSQGAEVDVVPVYETVPDEGEGAQARRRIEAGEIDAVTFTASSTVKNFVKLLPGVRMDATRVACIGPVTADTARDAGLRVDAVAREYTIPGLVQVLEELFSGADNQR